MPKASRAFWVSRGQVWRRQGEGQGLGSSFLGLSQTSGSGRHKAVEGWRSGASSAPGSQNAVFSLSMLTQQRAEQPSQQEQQEPVGAGTQGTGKGRGSSSNKRCACVGGLQALKSGTKKQGRVQGLGQGPDIQRGTLWGSQARTCTLFPRT